MKSMVCHLICGPVGRRVLGAHALLSSSPDMRLAWTWSSTFGTEPRLRQGPSRWRSLHPIHPRLGSVAEKLYLQKDRKPTMGVKSG
ncbi:hypothetical protein BDV18DRAFT_143876 [Aspergillus unguis]